MKFHSNHEILHPQQSPSVQLHFFIHVPIVPSTNSSEQLQQLNATGDEFSRKSLPEGTLVIKCFNSKLDAVVTFTIYLEMGKRAD